MLQYAYQRFFLLHFGWIWISTFYTESLCHENGIIQILADTFIHFWHLQKCMTKKTCFYNNWLLTFIFGSWCLCTVFWMFVCLFSQFYRCWDCITSMITNVIVFVAYNNKFPIICLDYTYSSTAQLYNFYMFKSNYSPLRATFLVLQWCQGKKY